MLHVTVDTYLTYPPQELCDRLAQLQDSCPAVYAPSWRPPTLNVLSVIGTVQGACISSPAHIADQKRLQTEGLAKDQIVPWLDLNNVTAATPLNDNHFGLQGKWSITFFL